MPGVLPSTLCTEHLSPQPCVNCAGLREAEKDRRDPRRKSHATFTEAPKRAKTYAIQRADLGYIEAPKGRAPSRVDGAK